MNTWKDSNLLYLSNVFVHELVGSKYNTSKKKKSDGNGKTWMKNIVINVSVHKNHSLSQSVVVSSTSVGQLSGESTFF